METICPYNFEPVRNAGEMSESESGGSDDDDQTHHVRYAYGTNRKHQLVYLWFVYCHAEHYRMHLLQGSQCSELEISWREMCDSA